MNKYIDQLVEEIDKSGENASFPFVEQEVSIYDWISSEEEDMTAPTRDLEEWTGISKEELPPVDRLSEEQVARVLNALKKMLDAYNCSFVPITEVPERIQYAALRDNFRQTVKVRQWHMGFFELCRPGTEHGKCALGDYCQCAFFADFFSDMVEDDRTPEEQRRAELDFELRHIKSKYGDDWMKYYPYHLDPDYDDDEGNPYNYGFDDSDDEDDDDWWRR